VPVEARDCGVDDGSRTGRTGDLLEHFGEGAEVQIRRDLHEAAGASREMLPRARDETAELIRRHCAGLAATPECT
jgi:hypothetical protein